MPTGTATDGVHEIYLGKRQRFLTVVTNLETGRIAVVLVGNLNSASLKYTDVDRWKRFRQSLEQVGAGGPDHLRQVSHPAACQPSGERSAAG
jgi:hypothetical protein